MLRQILAVVGGFVLWSILWLLLGQTLTASGLLPGPDEPVTAPFPLLALLVGSVVFSLAAGYSSAAISKTRGFKAAVALGLVLLLFGVFVQVEYWQLMPLWYHVAFLTCLVPASIAGAYLRTARAKA